MNESELRKLDYAIALQRAIEYHCRGEEVPAEIAKECPHHAEMLDKNLPLNNGDMIRISSLTTKI